jgi:hypothetical protein
MLKAKHLTQSSTASLPEARWTGPNDPIAQDRGAEREMTIGNANRIQAAVLKERGSQASQERLAFQVRRGRRDVRDLDCTLCGVV